MTDPFAPRSRGPHEIDVYELRDRLQAGERPLVVDVREPHELEISRIPGLETVDIPVSQFEARWPEELAKHRGDEVILLCRSGTRTARVQAYLAHSGFTNARNLVGGILAWSSAIDQSVPRY